VPTYQYACKDCGHAFEQVQSFSDDALTVCPQCEGRLRKVFNAVGVVFKGSGFYRNDSRTDASKAPAAAGASGSSEGSTSDSGTSTKESSTPATTSTESTKPAKPAKASTSSTGSSTGTGSAA
jgi:putative FmdB family regulatory protein